MIPKILFIFLYIISCMVVSAQSYQPEIEDARLTIESSTYPGFKTFLDFDYKDVRKGWWKFSREFGKPVNMRKYYETTLVREDLENVKLISMSVKYGQGTMFYLSLNNQGIPGRLEAAYLGQIKTLLFEFKQEYYLSFLEEELQSLERQAVKVTRKVDRARGNRQAEENAFLELEKVNRAMDLIREKIRQLQ